MKRINPNILKTTQLVGDFIILNLSFLISFYLNLNSLSGVFRQAYLFFFIQINLYWMLSTLILKPQFFPIYYRITMVVRKSVFQLFIHFLLISTVFAFQKFTFIPRIQIISTYIIIIPLLLFWRVFCIRIIRTITRKGYNQKDIIIVGYGELTERMIKYFEYYPGYGFKIIGVFDNHSPHAMGQVENLYNFLNKNKIDEIYICLPYVRDDDVRKIIDYGERNHLKIKVIPNFNAIRYKGLSLEKYADIPVIDITAFPLEETNNRITKRIFDLTGAVFFLIFIASWLFPIIALLIKLESKGPVFFKQYRSGRFNKPFLCYKFRTMVVNQEADVKQATKDDPRITKFGAILRRTSVDELPQFINVFKGEMSLIGPRPHIKTLNENFSPLITGFEYRHLIKPGITGLAQAKGFRGETSTTKSMRDRVKMDNFYISHWSLSFDIKILFNTFASLIKFRKNAY